MAGLKVTTTKLTHKDGKPRRKLKRTRASVNSRPIDLRKLAARRTLVARR